MAAYADTETGRCRPICFKVSQREQRGIRGGYRIIGRILSLAMSSQ